LGEAPAIRSGVGSNACPCLISEGVFERLPELVFVFTDGGFGVFPPLLWREDAKARALKDEMPWVSQRPSEYLERNVRFVARSADFPRENRHLQTALDLSHADKTLMYGSNYPMWDLLEPNVEMAVIPDALRERILSQNARSTYPKLVAQGYSK
jgi:predicted TIM-barrel fold metal-dependent hydrolase